MLTDYPTQTEEPTRSDLDVEETVRGELRAQRALTDLTLAVSVDGRRVAIAGCVPSHEEFDVVQHVAEQHADGREVLNLVSISTRAAERDAQRARALTDRLRTRFSASELHVAVMGDTAVLSGEARTRRDRAEIATLAALEPHIERTVNQIRCGM